MHLGQWLEHDDLFFRWNPRVVLKRRTGTLRFDLQTEYKQKKVWASRAYKIKTKTHKYSWTSTNSHYFVGLQTVHTLNFVKTSLRGNSHQGPPPAVKITSPQWLSDWWNIQEWSFTFIRKGLVFGLCSTFTTAETLFNFFVYIYLYIIIITGIRLLTIYVEKPDILVGKSNGSPHSVWEALAKIRCDFRQCNFSTHFSLFSWFGYYYVKVCSPTTWNLAV